MEEGEDEKGEDDEEEEEWNRKKVVSYWRIQGKMDRGAEVEEQEEEDVGHRGERVKRDFSPKESQLSMVHFFWDWVQAVA